MSSVLDDRYTTILPYQAPPVVSTDINLTNLNQPLPPEGTSRQPSPPTIAPENGNAGDGEREGEAGARIGPSYARSRPEEGVQCPVCPTDAGESASVSDRNILNEILRDNYIPLGVLGEGAYGVVYKVQHRATGRLEALKLLRYSEHCERFALAPSVIREVAILKKCRHPFIVELLDITSAPPNHLALHFELMRSDLRLFIDEAVAAKKARLTGSRRNATLHGLPMALVKRFALQILIGTRFAHCQHLIHRDLKPQNILVSHDGCSVKLADWGLARPIKPRHTHQLLTREVVTLWYRPPELLLGCQRYDRSVDIWSIGVIIFHMVTGMPLIHCPTAATSLFAIFQIFGTPRDRYFRSLPYYRDELPQWPLKDPKVVLKRMMQCHPENSDELVDFLSKLLALKPSKRCTARQAIWHSFLDDTRAEYLAAAREL